MVDLRTLSKLTKKQGIEVSSERLIDSVYVLGQFREVNRQFLYVLGQFREVNRQCVSSERLIDSLYVLGQGRFGKVYTAVNNQTGDLMAMKEIQLQPNDHRTIRRITEELRIFEGIQHYNLVRYYGVEIHRKNEVILDDMIRHCIDWVVFWDVRSAVPLAFLDLFLQHSMVHLGENLGNPQRLHTRRKMPLVLPLRSDDAILDH
uniref:Protein kinase domain-containing protein n=1 Tax=Timema cristinae TaxID=61476 RepID=A0A7R9DHC6_TIMCR|nr:unnamed protein product [Timema cristinae]